MARFLLYLLNLIFVVLIGWILSRVLQRLFAAPSSPRARPDASANRQVVAGKTARDPVCGMFVSTEVSLRLTRGNETLHFCSPACLEKYQKM